MLGELIFDTVEIKRRKEVIKDIPDMEPEDYIPQSDPRCLIEQGVYQSSFPFNFPKEECVNVVKEHFWGDTLFVDGKFVPNPDFKEGMKKSRYGIADDVEQIKKHFEFEVNDLDKKFIIEVTPVYKKDQPSDGGWRWHKWGEYIGEHDIQCEYLYDEKGIKMVLVYHLHELTE